MPRVFPVAALILAAAMTSANAASATAQIPTICGKRADILTGFASTGCGLVGRRSPESLYR